MTHPPSTRVFFAGIYIFKLFNEELPHNRVFHNFNHTLNVVRGVHDICVQTSLTPEEKEILLLAAWFHDSGHTVTYYGHEAASQQLAREWLEKENYPEENIARVLACIKATELPQLPQNTLEEVICDADLFHLSLGEYYHIQFQLRAELFAVFEKQYTDVEWMEENLEFLHRHQYFTAYGKTVLTQLKQQNIEMCERLHREYQMNSED